MEWWQPIALGAGIAILAGPLTEWVRHYFTRKHEQDERRRAFQKDTLVALLENLTNGEVAWRLALQERKNMGWPEHWQIDHAAVFIENFIEARRQRVLVDDDNVRKLAEEAMLAAHESLGAATIQEADEKAEIATEYFFQVDERIGKLVRAL